jgi:hypothetical protein
MRSEEQATMTQGYLDYKCRNCGAGFETPEVPDVEAFLQAAMAQSSPLRMQLHGKYPREIIYSMYTAHTCEDGIFGIGDLVGGRHSK